MPPSCNYPTEPPIATLHVSALGDLSQGAKKQASRGCTSLVAIQMHLLQESLTMSAESAGEVGILFQLSSFLEDAVSQQVGSSGDIDSTAKAVSFEDIRAKLWTLLRSILPSDKISELANEFRSGGQSESSSNTEVGPNEKGNSEDADASALRLDTIQLSAISEDNGMIVSQSIPIATVEQSESINKGPKLKKKSRSGHHPFWSRSPVITGAHTFVASSPAVITQSKLLTIRQKLPAWSLRDSFLRMCAENLVMVVTGETGCGKVSSGYHWKCRL